MKRRILIENIFLVICILKIFSDSGHDYLYPELYKRQRPTVQGEELHKFDGDGQSPKYHVVMGSLVEAQKRIKELEEKLAGLELRIPKKFPETRFLNYHFRKRILVIMTIMYYCFTKIYFGNCLQVIILKVCR